MAFSEFLAANFWYIFLVVFIAGTVILSRTKVQRTFIIFLIRTTHGIRYLEKIGNISPRLWKLLADFSIIVSFGGFGALYVSKYRKVFPLLLLLGIISLFLLSPIITPMFSGILFIPLLAVLLVVRKAPPSIQHKAHFILASVLLFSAVLGFSGGIRPGPSSYIISSLTGIFGLPGLLVSSLAAQAGSILFQQSSLPGVSPLLPGVNTRGEIGFMFPGFDLFIPLWSGLAALIILLVSHEFCHGILARVQGIKVTSMGLLTAGILPIGAFVEPDEKDLEKRKSEEKMRVYAMGSFANLLVAALATVLFLSLSFVVSGMVNPNPQGVEVLSVERGLPAEILPAGTIIQKLNGVEVKKVEDYLNLSASIVPGENVTLETNKGVFTLQTLPNPKNTSKAYLGFSLGTKFVLKEESNSQEMIFNVLLGIISTLEWVFFLNLNVAIVNLLPIAPFDGSKMFEELLKSLNLGAERRKKVIQWVVYLVVALLILNALPLGKIAVNALG